MQTPEIPQHEAYDGKIPGQRLSSADLENGGWRTSKDLIANGKLIGDYGEGETPPNKCSNLQASCKCGGGETTDPGKAADELLKDAKKYNPLFTKLLYWLKEQGEKVSETDHGSDFAWDVPKVKPVGLKGKARMLEKIEQKYGCVNEGLSGARQLTDVVRGSLYFKKESAICFLIEQVLNKKDGIICENAACPEGLNKVSVRNGKNRFNRDAAGMRDYLINVFMSTKDDPAGHVAGMCHSYVCLVHAFGCMLIDGSFKAIYI